MKTSIYTYFRLMPPAHNCGGPDGRGWNRLRVDTLGPSPQCAMKPKTYEALKHEVRRGSSFCAWGPYGPCTGSDCRTCKYSQPFDFDLCDNSRLLVRIIPADGTRPEQLCLMNKPDINSRSCFVTWNQLARMANFEVAGKFRDNHTIGFWIEGCNFAATGKEKNERVNQ